MARNVCFSFNIFIQCTYKMFDLLVISKNCHVPVVPKVLAMDAFVTPCRQTGSAL